MMYFLPILAAIVSLLSLRFLLSSRFGQAIQDIPNERSLHITPIPRIGGIGIVLGILSGWAFILDGVVWWVLLPMLMLVGVSLIDDMRGLSVRLRFLVHLIAAAIVVVGSGISIQQGMLLTGLVFFITVWVTNLYNFMDGSDGLAGGMALFGFASYGIAGLIVNFDTFAALNFSIAASALGFLYYNFPPAKIFMGDAGAIPLGFLAAAMGVSGWQQGIFAWWFPLLIFSPFIVDTSITLLKRALRGENLATAHREHYYQRAIQLGYGHRKVVLAEYLLMLLVSLLAFFTFIIGGSLIGVGMVVAVIYLLIMSWLDRQWKVNKRA